MTYPTLKKNFPGIFIVLEGPEGSGKTTQSALLKEKLTKQGFPVVTTREPGSGISAIRPILVQDEIKLTKEAELLLFFADRAQHIETIIFPALEAGKIVICDRFNDSTRAYQIGGRGHSEEMVERLISEFTFGLDPNIVFFLDIPVEQGLTRSTKRLTRESSGEGKFESLGLEFHSKVYKYYKNLSKKSANWISIDATRSPEKVCEEMADSVLHYLAVPHLS